MSPITNRKQPCAGLAPVLALLAAQIFTSSWHVLGRHVMGQVPFLAPISFVLMRTLITSVSLLIVGVVHEGFRPFPSLLRNRPPTRAGLASQVGSLGHFSSSGISSASDGSGGSVGLPLSQSNSRESLDGFCVNGYDETGDIPASQPSPYDRHHRHRPKRKKRRYQSFKKHIVKTSRSSVPSILMMLHNIQHESRRYRQQAKDLNMETVQILFAGLVGMLLLPTCYTTGLILTSPTVASVWDGPMIPLGCFCAAVTLGLEDRSTFYPIGQVGSLLLAVGGSIIVLLVDYLGGGNGLGEGGSVERVNGAKEHIQFIRGNAVLMGVVAAYSATALLQKQLVHYPPIQLTGWMFGIGHIGCIALLLFDGMLGSRITGCSLGQALLQIHLALTSSPTFLYGVLYSALFVGGACFSINSYASSHLESSVITLFAAMQPPITAIMEWMWEGKGLGWTKIGGMGCVGVGMWFFTSIKRMETNRVGGGGHNQTEWSQKNALSMREHSYEKVNDRVSSNNQVYNGGASVANKKTHADV